MHEVQIQVLCIQVLDGLFSSFAHILWLVVRVVQLAGDPDILALNLAFFENVCKGNANFVLISIGCCTVNVPAGSVKAALTFNSIRNGSNACAKASACG